LYSLYKREKPDIVHHVGLKNILWGGLAAKISNVKGVVNAVSGLGGLFGSGKLSLITHGILAIMRYANNRDGVKVIFQNNEDLSIFKDNNVVKPIQVEFTKGSGIDLNEYAYVPEPENGPIKIIFTARMVKEKGVCDLIEAAELLKQEFLGKVKFVLCGRLTPNRTGVTKEYMSNHCDDEYLEWLGERNDIKHQLESSHIMAFPSYYREGLPKSLIEASAIGRPIVTCNSIGCKDVVEDGINGYLIEPQNATMLAMKLKELIKNKNLRVTMGLASRHKAEYEFSIQNVVDVHLKIYDSLR
jgi:glycosyltransferase involved in cell wall biosynthesis